MTDFLQLLVFMFAAVNPFAAAAAPKPAVRGRASSVVAGGAVAALVLFAPIVFNNAVGLLASYFSLPISIDLKAHIPLMLYGGLIITFLLVEPLGLAKLYDNARKYFLVWPFRQVRK